MIYFYETGEKELYDIPNDIEENNNVAALYPQIINKLSKELGKFLRQTNGQRPSFKKTSCFLTEILFYLDFKRCSRKSYRII